MLAWIARPSSRFTHSIGAKRSFVHHTKRRRFQTWAPTKYPLDARSAACRPNAVTSAGMSCKRTVSAHAEEKLDGVSTKRTNTYCRVAAPATPLARSTYPSAASSAWRRNSERDSLLAAAARSSSSLRDRGTLNAIVTRSSLLIRGLPGGATRSFPALPGSSPCSAFSASSSICSSVRVVPSERRYAMNSHPSPISLRNLLVGRVNA